MDTDITTTMGNRNSNQIWTNCFRVLFPQALSVSACAFERCASICAYSGEVKRVALCSVGVIVVRGYGSTLHGKTCTRRCVRAKSIANE